MSDVGVRVMTLLNVVVPLLFFMASLYLALHIAFARFIRQPDSPVLWFFGVVTGPLTRPVRAALPPNLSERQVRTISLAVYVVLWITARVVLHQLTPVRAG